MGNTASTTSRKHQKKRAAPRKIKHTKKSPATTNNTMRGIKSMMTPATTKKVPRKRAKQPAKKNDASSMVKRYGPIAWSKAKASGVGPFKNKRAPPPRKAGLFSKFSANKRRY